MTRLSVVVTNGESTLAVLSLLCSVLLHRNGNENRNDNGDDEALSLSLAAAVSVQLVPTLAFGQLKHVKEWTSRVLAAVDRYTTDDSERASASLLSMLWSNTSAARCWLHSLESDLSLIETPSTNTSYSLFPPTATLLLSLVHHPEAAVATAAVEGVIAAVHAAPLFGITALPVLIHKLHTTVEKIIMLSSNGSGSGEKINKKLEYKEALATVLSTLYALPRLAVHPSTVAFTIRALQPLLAPPAPEFLQGVALRLLCEMWLTTGRGFPHLRTALLSYAAPSGGRRTAITPDMVENSVLRRAWAASLADVCDQDGERAQDLVHSITECLANQEKGAKPTAEVQAAGLECVAELCEADILDFYKAWKVVKPLVPTLPQHPLAAAAWLRFLASGGLDAAVYPEISRGILKALWAAACDVSLSQVVRNQACASLAAFDFVVLEENDLLSQEMWEYAALLKTSSIITNSTITNSISRSTNTTITSNSSRSCEELVVHVLGYEHATRRRQRSGKESTKLTTGKSTGRLPWSNRTRAAAAALGSDGGARGVQHKLVSTFPKALLGCGSRDPKEFIRRIPDISPIAVLLLWSPPPPSSSSSQQTAKKTTNATAVVAKQAGAAYCSVFAELCKQSDAGFNGTTYTNNSQVLAAWASFLRRWTSAAKDAAAASAAAGVPTTPTPNEKTTAGAQAVWQVIKASLQSGNTTTSTSSVNVTVVSTAACAAAALASSVFPQPIKLIVEEVFEFLTQHAQYDLNGSIFIQAASCTALGHCSDVARSILGLPAASAALEVLQRHLANADAPPAVRAASAIGLSLAVKQLSSKVNASLQNVGTLVKSLVLSLLAASRVDDAPVTSFLQQTDFYQEDSSKEVVDAVLIGLSDCLSIVLSVGLPTDLLCTLRTAATEMLLSATSPTLAVHGVCQLLKSSTLVGYKINSITATEVVETLNYLQQIAASGSAAFTSTSARNARSGGGGGQMQNGKLAGAAALALGSMIPSLIKEGFVFPSSTSSSHYLESIVLLAKNSSDSKLMSSRGSAKQGAAAGIASVLSGVLHQSGGGRMGEDVVVVVFNEMEKQAFDVLESLSLKDEDSRARRGCAHALAELCWSARHGGKKLQPLIEDSSTSTAATAESATTANLTKGIASLPDNSALRYLCETLESGTWPEVQDHHDNDDDVEKKETPVLLTSEQAASVLRCLAAAPRLPVLDWSAACRRVLRSHPGSAEVQKGVVLLFSSHASVSQALQMYEFISEDIFGQPGFINWQPEAQYAVLKEMHQLLVALPDAEAASVLRMLCSDTVCPDVFSNRSVDKSAVEWQTTLLQGLSATAATMKEDNINLGKIAWECAVHAVLPKLPVPCTWPLGLNLSTLQHYVEKEDTVNNNKIMAPWLQLLTCALTASKSSATVLDRLCSEEIPPDTFAKNPVHWTWLCAALVENNGVDLRGLQQPRNFILSGSNGGDSRGSIDKTMDIVLLLVSRAVGSCPTATIAQKQQWILDILHASANCAAPAAAVTLAVLATVAVASGSGGGRNNSSESCFGKAHNVLIECETAVNALPSSLRYLAETIKPCPVTLVTAIVEALGGTAAANDDWKGKRELQKQCCWALRHALPSETWVELYTCVEGRGMIHELNFSSGGDSDLKNENIFNVDAVDNM